MSERLTRNHERKSPSKPEIIRYNDDTLNLFYGEPGDEVSFDSHKYTHVQRQGYDRMIITTDSGNHYVLGNGAAINVNENIAFSLNKLPPDSLPDITVGESWYIPGVMVTTDVANVQIKYKKIVDGSYDSEGRRVDKPNPFTAAEKLIYDASQQLGLFY